MSMPILATMQDEHTHSDEPVEYVSIGEAARICGVSVGTVRNWERAGQVTSVRTPSNHRRYRRSDVEALLTSEAAS